MILFQSAFWFIIFVYIVASGVLLYHVYTFGINKATTVFSVIAYLIGSIVLLGLLYQSLQGILNSI